MKLSPDYPLVVVYSHFVTTAASATSGSKAISSVQSVRWFSV